MNCPRCLGGKRLWLFIVDGEAMVCPECQGSGIVSCCDTAGENYMKPEDYWADIAEVIDQD